VSKFKIPKNVTKKAGAKRLTSDEGEKGGVTSQKSFFCLAIKKMIREMGDSSRPHKGGKERGAKKEKNGAERLCIIAPGVN